MITGALPDDDLTLHGLFEGCVARHPDRTAVRHRGESISYRELDARAERIAAALRDLGAGPEQLVGVYLERSTELLAALIGVLKSGAAYLPLDPAYPGPRIAAVLEDSGATVVVTDSSLLERLPGRPGVSALCVDRLPPTGRGHDAANRCLPGNLAYVIHTSGSTGRPRGVAVEHRTVVALVRWWGATFPLEERAATLASSSISFDASVPEIFGTLCTGGAVVLSAGALEVDEVTEEIRLAFLVPAAAAALLRMDAMPPGLRTLLLGGEAVPATLVRELYAKGIGRVLNVYGPTEDTAYTTFAELAEDQAAPVPIGMALPGESLLVRDGELAAGHESATGELFIGGSGVARGYLRDPARTAERFLPDPRAASPGGRVYRTGDRVTRRPDGALEFDGRVDEQVKIRGYRVEPGEVEAALRRHPGVADAVVTAPAEDSGGRYLAAYLVLREGATTPTAVREWLRQRVPEHLVPTAWTQLQSVPRFPGGKIDRASLPSPASPEIAAREAPRTPGEAAIAAIWQEVLGGDAPGPHNDFYALGGHSLRAVQIVSRIRSRFGVELPLGEVLGSPTVAGQARAVERLTSGSAPAPTPIPRADRSAPIPLSAAQEAVWFFERLSPGMRSYQFQAALRFHGALDQDALRRALDEIVRRHEAFRTIFVEEEGRPVQRVLEPPPLDLPLEDLSAIPEGEREAALTAAMEVEFARPFDAGALPLARWNLYRTAPDRHVLLCVEHHLVHDGWSFGIFLRELTELYSAFVRGQPAELPEPRAQFADYAVWQRRWLESDEAAAQLDFWRARLAGAPPALELPADHPRPPRVSFRGRSLHLRLAPEVARAADAFSRRNGVTLYMTLLAAFQALVARTAGQDLFVLGGGTASRGRQELEDTIGMIVNVIPMRADLRDGPSLTGLVERVRTSALEEYAHQDVPFASIVEAIQPERTLDRNPIVQIAFNAHHAPYPELSLPGVEMEVVEGLGNHTAKFDLQVIVIPRGQQRSAPEAGGEIILVWEYSTDLFDHATVEALARRYERLLSEALARPETSLADLPLLDAGERARLIAWSGAPGSYDRDATVHGVFADLAARTPDAPAMEWDGEVWSFADLERASGHLAARLRAGGVRMEDRVCVWAERGPAHIVAMLGVLRAGGAYIPLALDYPAARLQWIADNAGARVLLAPAGSAPGLRFSGRVMTVDPRPAAPLPAPRDEADADGLACILYTSGTTGTPKGIGIPHRAVVRLAHGADYAPLGPGDRAALTANPAFDVHLWDVWASLLRGACMVGFQQEDILDPQRLARAFSERRITSSFLATALFNQAAPLIPDALARLRYLVFGGAAADPVAVRSVLTRGGPVRLVNGYGPTEGTTYTSVHTVKELAQDAVSVPIGHPLLGTRVYVAGPRGELVPPGVMGELWLGGDGLARGYEGRAALTAERFVPDPFSGEPGARLYRTGDRARWTLEGVLEYGGREDAQVKIRGYRVEPGEVEAVLRGNPDVGDAAVVVRADGPDQWLAAYAAPMPGAIIDVDGIRGYLEERLPPYMVPSPITLLPALPLTPNGKVDRQALPAAASEQAPVSPLGTDEEIVAAVWRDVLGVASIGPDDDFFTLGGHSLRALRVAARVGESFGVELPVAAVFEAPTVRTLAARARTLRDESLAERLAWVQGLSEEEVEALLAEPPS